jgi:hypothetical protein
MGLDVSTDLICGALVDMDRELLVTGQTIPFNCAKCLRCHESGMKFCGECGTRFMPQKTVMWAPRTMAFFEKRGMQMANTDTRFERDGLGPFFNVRGVRSSESDDGEVWAVGVEIPGAGLDMNRASGARPVNHQTILAAMAEVAAMLQDLDLPARDISVFPRMYVSV